MSSPKQPEPAGKKLGTLARPKPKSKTGKAEPSVESLRDRLIAAAAACVEEHGVSGVRARDIAAQANCSPGLIYYAFSDLDALIFALNRETSHRLHEALGAVLVADPRDNLDRLAIGYLSFAHDNKQLWRCLFEHRVRTGKAVSDDYRMDIMATFSRIPEMLAALLPNHTAPELEMLSRALFSAVHGIIVLGLDENFVAVPFEQLEEEICRFVAIFMQGLKQTNAQA
jgi:AcrR family transcriptional regulator